MGRISRKPLLGAAAMSWTLAGSPTAAESGCPRPPIPPPGAPNVLVIMTDDVGFAASSAMGGGIPTPNLERLAATGLTYNNFHTTGICSPTRAALLTGRNHHAVGYGTVADLARGEPGYNSVIPKSAGTVAQVLSAAGYDTAWLGKNHNVPTWQSGSLGPFDQWASGLGFQYFYGFHGGWTDQYAPQLIENTRMIDPPAKGDGTEAGYILDRDLADRAVAWLQTQRVQHPRTPFLMYYAPGTAHAPLQAPAEWIARFKGKFDGGWDVYREAAFARQQRMGIVPRDAKLSPLPEGIRPWAQLSADEKTIAARYMEVYAAMMAYCDAQVGRVLDELKASGQLDNTLVIFVEGDNGASGEGGELGSFNYMTRVSMSAGRDEEIAWSLAHLDDIGGPRSNSVGPVGWAAAMNTPLPYYKTLASRLGGVRNGMVVSWPAQLKARGIRSQFTDVTDVMPTILEATGIKAPESLGGVAQRPFDGVSFAYSFTQPKAAARHRTQYFEVFGNAAIYHDGWMLAERVKTDPRLGAAQPDPAQPWQLYDLTKDFSQTEDVAAAHPNKVIELKTLWQAEAARNQVLPLATSNLAAMLPGARPEPLSEPGRYVFHASPDRYPEGVFPALGNRSWTIAADVSVPSGGGEGVLATQGGRMSGWALTVVKGVPTFLYRTSDRDTALFRLAAPQALTAGAHKIAVAFTVDGPGFGKGGRAVLNIDGRPVAEGRIERTSPFKFAPEDATIGRDTGSPVSEDYAVPFAFSGSIGELSIELSPVAGLGSSPKP